MTALPAATQLSEQPVLIIGRKRLWQRHIARYESKLATQDERGCILWTGATDASGYGRMIVNRLPVKTHQIAWWLKNGPMPDGLEPDHTCEVKRCCNADHLEAVTHAENMRRCGARMVYCRAGKHRWDEQEPIINSCGNRHCRPCRNGNRRTGGGKSWRSQRDRCKNDHEFTPENTAKRSDGARQCLTCRRAANRRYKLRKKLARTAA